MISGAYSVTVASSNTSHELMFFSDVLTKGLEVGSMSYLPELFLEKHDLKVSCDLFPEFSSDSGWYLNDCWV